MTVLYTHTPMGIKPYSGAGMHVDTGAAASFLCSLIDIDTTRKANNETAAVRFLSDFFAAEGIPHRVFEPYPGRGSVTASIPGLSSETILLLTHLDTENERGAGGFTAAKGTIVKDRIFGRGALDCKGNIAVLCMLMKELKHRGITPAKTVLFAATADEENGGQGGMQWLLEHTDVFSSVVLALGEGGGIPVKSGELWYFTLQTGEHEAPETGNELTLPDSGRWGLCQKALEARWFDENTLRYLAELPANTNKRRIPEETFLQGLGSYLQTQGTNNVQASNYAVLSSCLSAINPDYRAMSFITPGYTDNRYLRSRHIETWGFFPLDPQNHVGGMHGRHEYISMASLILAYTFYYSALKLLAGW
jgi:acetylornithine deacetylase/succinyl-diaminopimelate desuccinylase-like protein